MTKRKGEIEDEDLDKEDNFDDDEEEDEDEEEEDADGDEDSEDEEEDDEESDDDDSSEDDDETPLPKNRKQFDSAVEKAVRKALKGSKDRSAADRRTSKNGKQSDRERSRSPKNDERLDSIEARQAKLDRIETKRQFGYATGLSPDEVDVVFKLRKNPTKKSINDPIIKGALDGYRAHKRAKGNIPGSGNGRPVKVVQREEKNMTPQEKRSRFEDKRRGYLAAKGR